MKIDTKEWLSLKEAAIYAGVVQRSVQKWHDLGYLDAIDPFRSGRVYSVKDLDRINKAKETARKYCKKVWSKTLDK